MYMCIYICVYAKMTFSMGIIITNKSQMANFTLHCLIRFILFNH